MQKFIPSLALCAVIFGVTARAHADPILPGGVINTPTTLSFGGTLVSSPPVNNITTSLFSANYSDKVYSDPNNTYCAGCLDFVYQIANIGKSGSVFSLNAYNFGSFETDAGFLTQGIDPSQITRSMDGSFLTFTFSGPDNDLAPGTFSDFLVIQTNATSFSPGGVSLQGGPSGNGPGSQPSAVPEPSSLILFGSGLLGLAVFAKKKLAF
jgi:PEP-CTERM motif